MSTSRSASEDQNRRMLRARDAMDRDFDQPLDIAALASIAYVSEAHFIRTFKETFGETPHRYLQRRRIERAMWDLRASEKPITDVAIAVGFTSLGTFSRTFRDVVGVSPSAFRQRTAGEVGPAPTCFRMVWQRPRSGYGEASSFGEANAERTDLVS